MSDEAPGAPGPDAADPADRSGPAGAPSDTPPPPPGPRRLRSLLIGCVIAALLAAVLFAVVGVHPGTGPAPGVQVGEVAPDFTLPAVGGGPPVHLDAIGRDRHVPVVLNFFASWCGPCRQETPLLAATAKAHATGPHRVAFVGVDVDDSVGGPGFVRSMGVTYPVGSDTTLEVTAVKYALNNQPNTFFIDASGHVVARVLGALTPKELSADLAKLTGT